MNPRYLSAAVIAVCGLGISTFTASASDEVIAWNQLLRESTRAQVSDAAGPGPTARGGALLHAAIFDAVNAISGQYMSAAVNVSADAWTDKRAAVAAAGYHTLSSLYGSNPVLQAQFETLYNNQIAAIAPGAARDAGIALGHNVANLVVASRAGDGHDDNTPYIETPGAGHWRSNYAPQTPGWGPNWGNVTPWVMASGDQFRPSPPPALTSQEYTDAWNEVYQKGAAVGSTRTADETEIAWFWGNDRDGSYKPPGHLNALTEVLANQQFAGLSADDRLMESARLFALVNVGMYDAAVAAWDSKYNTPLDFWRPIAGIHEGDTDGNPDTFADTNWEPLSHAGIGGGAFTPPFPAYVSGHATFGAVVSSILEQFFGTDNITFTLGTDDGDAVGVERTFHSLSDAAWENAISRIFLGVHWRFDATAGNELGYDIGEYLFANFMQVIPAPGGVATFASVGLLLASRRRRR